MNHLGDISKINGAEIEPVDVITFGSPCQDLSTAGKRAGIGGARSGLFMEAVRIIREMREATDGKYPTYALWENVPGAFSSNGGEDFRVVLEELIKISEPGAVMPAVPKKGWAYADSYVGDGWSLAYRVFDTQYWPRTPQRRRRIYLVADFGGQRAREVLFEREGLRGYLTESPAPGERVTAYVEAGPGAADPAVGNSRAYGISSYHSHAMQSDNPHSGIYEAETSRTLDLNGGNPACNQGGVAIVQPMAFSQNQRDELRDLGDKAGCLQAQPGMKQQTFILDSIGGQAEYGKESNVNGTLRAGALGAVAYCYDARGNGDGKTASTITGDHENRVTDYTSVVTYATDIGFFNTCENVSPSLLARGYKDPHLVTYPDEEVQYIVRRLTPTECARLQGFPDAWGHPDKKESFTDEEYQFWLEVRNTHAAINGRLVKAYTEEQMLRWYNKLHSDSAEYKMWGNGIALPPSLYCMQGIADALEGEGNEAN